MNFEAYRRHAIMAEKARMLRLGLRGECSASILLVHARPKQQLCMPPAQQSRSGGERHGIVNTLALQMNKDDRRQTPRLEIPFRLLR